MLRLSDLGSMKPRVLPPDQKDDRDQDLRDVDDVFNNDYDEQSNEKRLVVPLTYNRDEITHTNQPPSPLLHLPAELRNKIYTFIFTNTTININKLLIKKDVLGRYPSVRAVLYTCRQIYIEASALSFTLCTFVPSYFALRFFSSSNLPTAGFGRIERLWLTEGNGKAIIEGKDEMKGAYLKEWFASLKLLEIEVWRLKVNLTDAQAREKVRDAFGVPDLCIVGRRVGEDGVVAV
ncbi:hypothetical protein J4E83_006481 [Alternaria metachromatica]|uniref:uncharacterized protein n=1 Tax=Alternaria metachromatica TaxID=283354 RepID=UPI0020C2E85E|nr:uncharacterized protein J4E83_006481 [Alternaria metachromatica]KAI4616899.1 hypothetical protein J4E83_006481 [Alternaria metachromatica]